MTEQLRELEDQLAANPDDQQALQALLSHLWEEGDWRAVVELYESHSEDGGGAYDYEALVDRLAREADELEGGPEKAAILLAIGDLSLGVLDRYDQGMDAYQKAFVAHRQDVTPLHRARAVYEHNENWPPMLEIYDIELRVAENPTHRAGILLEMAQVAAGGARDFERANQLLDRLDKLDVESTFAGQLRDFYSRQMTVDEGIEEALALAEEALNEEASQMAGQAFLEAAQLEYERRGGNPKEALSLANRALELAPEDEEVKLIVEALAREVADESSSANGADGAAMPAETARAADKAEEGEEVDETEEAAEAEESKEAADDPEALDEPDVASFFSRQASAFDGTAEEATEVLAKDKAHAPALATIRRDLLDKGDLAALAEVLEDSVRYFRKKDGEWEVMTELANLYWLELGDDERAEYYFKRLKLLDDEHPDVFKFYEAYYESQGKWRKLFTLLAGRLDHLDDADDYRIVVEQLSDIAEGELGSPEKAIDVWKKYCRKFPDDGDARRRLRHLYEDHEKWNALVDLLKEQVRGLSEKEESEAEQIRLLEEMAHIYRVHLGLDTMVMNLMAEILELDPRHPSAFGQLRDLYEENRRFNDLAQLLADAAEHAADDGNVGAAVGNLLEVADIWEERLNNQTQAIPYLERIVEIAPEEGAVRDRLREIYEKRRDFGSLFDLRLQEARLLGSQERDEELRELLELAEERLDDEDRKAKVLEALLVTDDENLELLNSLEAIRRHQQDWDELAQIIERRAELLDGEEGLDAFAQAAQIHRQERDDRDASERLWKRVRQGDEQREDAFDALATLFVEQRRFDDLEALYLDGGQAAELYERLGTLADGDEDARALQKRRVRLAEEELQAPQKVIAALEALLAMADDEDQADAIRRQLIPWYDAVGDLAAEATTRQVLLDRGLEGDEAFDEMLRLATLEERQEQPDAALAWAMKAFESMPERHEAFVRAEALAIEAGLLSVLVDAALERAETVDDDAISEQIWVDCARIQWQELQDFDAAIDLYEKLRERHPAEFEFMEALDVLYDRTEQPKARIAVLNAQIDHLRDQGAADVDVVDQLSKIADVQRTHLDEAEAARDTYSKILDLQPDHLGAVRGIKELHREDGQWMDVVDYLLREIPLAPMDSQEAVWQAKLELANVYRDRLDDLHEALHYYGQILGENPEYEAALTAVRGLLAEDGLAREAAILLEPIFRDLQQFPPLAEALEARLRVSQDPFEEQEILDELIPIYADELGQTEQAFEYARRQFEIDPERDDIWLRFEQLGAKLNRWELIEEMFTAESPLHGHESSTRYDLLRHLAAIREHQLQMTDKALVAWERLHERDPLDKAVLEALERLYRKTERTDALNEVLLSRAELVDIVDDRIALLLEAGEQLAGPLDDAPLATDVFEKILTLEPAHEEAVSALRQLLRRQQRWHDLDALLSDQANQTLQPERRRQFLSEQARLRYDELDDKPGSVAILCDLLDDDPGDDQVLEFARRVDDELAEDDANVELRLELARTLDPIYRMRGEYERLDEILQLRLAVSTDVFAQVELLDELVEVRQKRLSDPLRALDALHQAVVIQPDDETRRSKLLEMATGLEVLEDAMATLEEAAQAADPFIALDIWKRLAQLADRKLGDAARAIEYLEEAHRLDESDLKILHDLERHFESTGQPDRLCENLREQARFADPDERLNLLRRVGTLQAQVLDRPIDASETYRQILEIDPADLGVMDALEALYRQQGEYFDLVELYRQKVARVDDEEQRRDVLFAWAEVAENELNDRAQTIDVMRRVLDVAPEHDRALAELDRLLASEAQWAEWTEIARRRLDIVGDDNAALRLDLELRLAQVLVDELFEIEAALAIYRQVLDRNATQKEAVEALEKLGQDESWLEEIAQELGDIYKLQNRWQDLADLYERRRDQAMDPDVKSTLEYERACLLRDRLEQPVEAIEAFARAWKGDLANLDYRGALIQLASRQEQWQLLVDELEEGLAQLVDPDQSEELHLMLAQLWQDVLGEPLEAEGHLRQVLAQAPMHDDAFGGLVDILEQKERWHDLIDLLEQRQDLVIADDEAAAIDLLMTIADIQQNFLDDGFGAVDTLQRVRQLDGRHSTANERLEALYRSQDRWDELAQFYEEQAERTPLPSERLAADMALAKLCRGPLMQVERAIDLYGQVLQIESDHAEAIAALEEVFEEGGLFAAKAAHLLEPIYRADQDHPALVAVLQTRVDDTAEPAVKAELLRELLQLFEDHVEAPQQAWVAAGQLFKIAPEDRLAQDHLWSLTARAEAWSQLAAIYDWTLANQFEIDQDLRRQLLLALSRLYAERVGDVARGLETAREALRLDAESDEAQTLVESLLIQQKDWPGLADFYRNRADYSGDDQRTQYWYERLAVLYEDVLGDVDATVDVYARLLEMAPGNENYRSAMERILVAVGRWYDLADIYRQRIAGARDESVVLQNRFDLAGVLENELDSLEEAVSLYRQILETDPNYSDAIRALEGIRRDLESREGPWRSLQRQVIEALLAAYDQSRSWRRVDDLLNELVELVDDPAEQVELLVDKAQILLQATSDDIERVHALTTLARAYCLDPDNDEIDELIDVLADDLDGWERVIPIFLDALGNTDDVDRQGLILAAVAKIYENQIGDIESAVAAYQQSVEISAESDLALEKLQELYGAMEKWEPLVQILERRLEAVFDPDQQQHLRKRIARIYDQVLGDARQALRLYQEIRREEPTELSHLVVMERLYQDLEDYQALEDLLLDKLQLIDAPSLRVQALKKLGALRRDHLDRIDDAIACFNDALAIEADDREALEALLAIYRAEQRWSELLDIMGQLRAQAESVADAHEIALEMGDILLDEAGDAQRAFQYYREVLEEDGQNYMARGALFRLLANDDVRRQAAQILTEAYRADQEWDELEALYQRLIESSDDPEYVAEQYLALAKMQEHQLGLAIKAFATLSDAMQHVPQVDAIRQRLEELAGQVGTEDDLVAIYEDALEMGIDDPEVARALHLVVGKSYAHREALDEAIPHFEAVLDVDEFDDQALNWLDRIYQAQQNWERLMPILETKLTVVSGQDYLQTAFQLAYLKEVVLEDNETAFDLYRQVLLEVPAHGGAVEGLERICADPDYRQEALALLEPTYRDEGEWAKLAHVFALKLDDVELPSERADLHRQIAQIKFDELDEIDEAFAHWSRALAHEPHDGQVQARLEQIAEVRGLYRDLIALYEEIIDAINDPVRQVELATAAGQWALEELEDPQLAAAQYRRVLEVEPEHEVALEVLERVAREQGDKESLAAVLAARVQSSFDEDEQIALYTELATVRLGIEDYEGAIAAFEKLLLLEGDDLERLETLAQLYEVTAQWQQRADTLERLLPYREDPVLRHDTLVAIGRISLEELGDFRRARRVFESALEIEPDNREILHAMEKVYSELEDWSALEELIARQLAGLAEDEDDERVRLYIARAELRYDATEDVDGAIADYQQAFAIRDDHPAVVAALGDLYRSQQRWEDLLDLLGSQVPRAEDRTVAIGYLLEMATIAHERLGALDRAIEFAAPVLDYEAYHEEALDRLEAVYRQQQDWSGVIQILDRRLEGADEAEQSELLQERARTLYEDAGELAEAAVTYRQLLETSPDDEALLSRLEEIYDALDDGQGLYELLAHKVARSDDDQAQVALYLEMGEVARKYLDDQAPRIDALEAARAVAGDDLEVVEPLLDAYIEGGRVDLAQPLLESVIETLTEERKMKEVVRFHHLRGKLAQQQGDLEAAQSAFEEAHRLDATYIPNLLSLGKLLFNRQDWEQAKKIFQILLLHQMNIKDEGDKVQVYFYLGAIREQNGDERGARDMYKRALRVDPSHEDAKAAMAALDA